MRNNNNLTEQELIKALQEKGYSEDEAEKIVKDARNENKVLVCILLFGAICLILLGIVLKPIGC